MKSSLIFLLLYYSILADNPCKEYSNCRMELLSRRFLCLEEPRKAVQQTCKLKEDLRLVWKASLWKEKWLADCLLSDVPSPDHQCFQSPPINDSLLTKCGLSLRLLEERCDLLKDCCGAAEMCLSEVGDESASRDLKERIRVADEKAAACNRRLYSVIQNITVEDMLIARSIIQKTARVRELLSTLNDASMTIVAVPSVPLSAYKNKTIKSEAELVDQPVVIVDSDREIRRKPSTFGRIRTAGFETGGVSRQKKSRAYSPSFSGRPLHKRKAKTLFVHLLNAKRKGRMKPWRDARTRSVINPALQGLSPRRLNTNRRIIPSFAIPLTGTTKEEYFKRRIKEIKKRRLLYNKRKTVETTLKPVYLAMKFVDRKTDKKELSWDKKHKEEKSKSSSEEDFDAEFEQKAGSLVSFGPNALPLPGSRKFADRPIVLNGKRISPVDDPFENIVVKKELNTADVTDIATLSPLARPRQILVPLDRGFGFPTPAPIVPLTTQSLWNPLLSFFSTPAPFYFRTPYPVRIWPFKKKLHGVKNTDESSSANEKLESDDYSPEKGPDGGEDVVSNTHGEKGYCIRYRTCLRTLEKTEKDCDTVVKRTKRTKRSPRQSVCLNLDKRFQLTELVKKIEKEYRQCVYVDTEGLNKDEEECSILSPLPENLQLIESCGKKISELRRHCELASRCCTTTETCQSSIGSSQILLQLKKRQKELETMKYRCQQKEKNSKKAVKVEGEARLDGNN